MKSLLFTFLSLFIITELAIAQSSGYSNVASGESSKAKETKPSKSDSGKFNDSLKQIALTAEVEALHKQLKAQSEANQAQLNQLKAELEKAKNTETAREDARKLNDSILLFNLSSSDVKLAQLKTKSENNQSQIDQLKVENARTKIAGTVNRPIDNSLVIGQLKAQSDTNQIQIEKLRTELVKAKETEAAIAVSRKLNDSLLLANMSSADVKLAQLKTKSESNQSQIDQLKVENARTKIAGSVNRPVDNSLVIAQLKAQSDSNQAQIAQLKRELANSKNAETAQGDSRRLKDSVVRHFLIAETDALLTQLKAKADTNQIQFERLKTQFANTKTAGSATSSNKENDEVIALLKTKSDAYQVQIDQLKVELVNAKEAERAGNDSRKSKDSLAHVNSQASDVKLALLKARSESNQAQIDQLKVDNARTKIAGTITSSNTDNTIVIGQLKAKSDTNQAQIDRLKLELANSKNTGTAQDDSRRLKDSSVRHFLIAETDALLTQLKTKADTNQIQFERLKAEFENTKTAGRSPSANIGNDALITQLKAKSDTNQVQIDQLKMELAKVKNSEKKPQSNTEYDAQIAQLKTKSDNNQAQIDRLVAELAKTREDMAKTPYSLNSKKTNAPDKQAIEVQLIEKSDSDKEIDKLNPELEKIKKSVSNPPDALRAETIVPASKTSGFIDENGASAGNGFYVVIGSFGNKENAEKFKAANIIKGHRNTKIIQNKATKMYNIFALKTNNKMDADVERAKYKGEYSNVWILKLE